MRRPRLSFGGITFENEGKKNAPLPGRFADQDRLFLLGSLDDRCGALVEVFLLDKSGQRTVVLRLGLEGVTNAGSFAEAGLSGDFSRDFLFHFDVVEIVFHGS